MLYFLDISLILITTANAFAFLTSDFFSNPPDLDDKSSDNTFQLDAEWVIADQPSDSIAQIDEGNGCKFMSGTVSCGSNSLTPSSAPSPLPVVEPAIPLQPSHFPQDVDTTPQVALPISTNPEVQEKKCDYAEVGNFQSEKIKRHALYYTQTNTHKSSTLLIL